MLEQDLHRHADAELAQEMPQATAQLLQLTQRLRESSQAIADAMPQRPQLPYFVAAEMLRLSGHTALAWLWLKAARSAARKETADALFYAGKRRSACYYFAFLFPEVQQLLGVVDACLAAEQPPIPSDLTLHNAA